MKTNLVWITVSNIETARNFYKEQLGFTERTYSEEYKWSEMSGPDGGTVIGLAEKAADAPIQPGDNAVITFTVSNLESTKADFLQKGIQLVGETQEVPGHVKMQMFVDADGNHYQIVEML